MFSGFLVRAQQWRVFASAHSRGLRRDFYASTDNADRFATAHSCGLRLLHTAVQVRRWSLPQRIRAGCDLQVPPPLLPAWSLPQRIRAGCDLMLMPLAFADSLCHSAFVRVATPFGVSFQRAQTFATAHSRGLRPSIPVQQTRQRVSLPQRIRAGCDCGKAMQRTANLLREGR